jgi:hypothetical protein
MRIFLVRAAIAAAIGSREDEMMLGQPDGVVAEFFGRDRKLDFLAIELGERDLGRRRIAKEQSETEIHPITIIFLKISRT